VAAFVRLPAFDQAQVGDDSALEDIIRAVEILDLLALRYLGPEPRLGVEAGNARAPPAHSLRERALRAKLHLELSGEELPLELLVLADVGRDHFLHLARAKQFAEPLIIDARIVRGDGQVLDPARLDRVDQPLGNAAQPEPARGDGHAVAQQSVERRLCIGIDFLHSCPLSLRAKRSNPVWIATSLTLLAMTAKT